MSAVCAQYTYIPIWRYMRGDGYYGNNILQFEPSKIINVSANHHCRIYITLVWHTSFDTTPLGSDGGKLFDKSPNTKGGQHYWVTLAPAFRATLHPHCCRVLDKNNNVYGRINILCVYYYTLHHYIYML